MSMETTALDQPKRTSAPPSFHLLAKPSGSTCNIDCTYCFFLSKEALYPNDKHRMSRPTLEAYIRQLLESHRTRDVTVAWQGGEPTLMKLEFFEEAVALVEKYRRPGQTVHRPFRPMACCSTTRGARSSRSTISSSASASTGRESCTIPTGGTAKGRAPSIS